MRTRIKPAFSLLLSLLLLQSTAQATTEWDHGRVNMRGSIVDAACSIATGDRVQAIEMATEPVGAILRDARGTDNKFDIQLSNCVLARDGDATPNQKRFSLTFSGGNNGDDFQVSGEAKGVALRIADTQNNIARPGVALLPQEIDPKNMTLNFHIFLVGDQQIIQAGNYRAAVNFNMNYY
ncbi:MAG: fimbrial protein [Scandinavium sp.]|uniref:fimbrial protein n=1 Tax=Scandinavium sp. TaxID=2830653 RepID=UPI003F3B9D31